MGRGGGEGRRGKQAPRCRALLQRLRHPPARQHLLPRGGQPQRRRHGDRREPGRRRCRVLLQHALQAAANRRVRRGHGRHLRGRRRGAPPVHGDQGRHSGLRRLLLQPGDARLLRAGHQGLLAVHRLPRRLGPGGRHERGSHHDAAHPHQDDPRRAGGRALGDALPLRRPGGQPLHGRDLLPHGLHE